MPAALPFPIGSRFYDWKYESEPEPHMNGRRIYHARGKVLGGSSSINGMIFQRGNPLDYERWGADAGMDDLGLRALPAVLQADGTLHGRGPRGRVPRSRGPARPGARACPQPAVRGVLRGGAAGGLPADRGRERVPSGGVRAVRPQHPQRTPAVRGARVPASGHEPPEPRRRDPRVRDEDPVRGRSSGGRGVHAPSRRREARDGRRGRPVRRRDQLPPAAAAVGGGQRGRARRARHRRRARPARGRRAPAGPPGGLHPVRVQAARLGRAVHEVAMAPVGRPAVARACGAGPARRTTSRPAGSSAATTTSRTRT